MANRITKISKGVSAALPQALAPQRASLPGYDAVSAKHGISSAAQEVLNEMDSRSEERRKYTQSLINEILKQKQQEEKERKKLESDLAEYSVYAKNDENNIPSGRKTTGYI